MIIIRVMGGLGNQMQQFALYEKLRSLGREAKLDLAWFHRSNQNRLAAPRELELTRFLNLTMEACTNAERNRFLKRSPVVKALAALWGTPAVFTESRMYHPEILEFTDRYIEGYFACEKYYADRLETLRHLFVFPAAGREDRRLYNMELMNEMEERHSVSVHVRRGDYLEPENAALFSGITTDAYYERAMSLFVAKEPRTHFYLFSDDPAWLKEKYTNRDRFTVVEGNSGRESMLDMQLMSHCRGNICANSTFSFWGARLNAHPDKMCVRPLVMRNNQPADPAEMHELWKGWTLIDSGGRVV
ncbi:MAG: alpha-1,2-fucosyltransferase [Lachnospiraceae bacterium]|nr:alpha-1,2-fucosyltransferase [Lachnospiraceae bacterium]